MFKKFLKVAAGIAVAVLGCAIVVDKVKQCHSSCNQDDDCAGCEEECSCRNKVNLYKPYWDKDDAEAKETDNEEDVEAEERKDTTFELH